MGACNFITFERGSSYRGAFDKAVRDAVAECGYGMYNGTISTTELSRRTPKVIRSRYTEKARDEAMKVAEMDHWGEKRETRVIDLGVIEWETTTYEKVSRTSQAAAKISYQTFFIGYADDREICRDKTAAAAKQKVIDYMEHHRHSVVECYQVKKESRCVMDGKVVSQDMADTRLFEMVRKTKVTKSKPKAGNAKAIHMWAFYGWAAC